MNIDWTPLVHRALSRWETPFFLFAWSPVEHAIAELAQLDALQIPVRHWLSFKTHPLRPLLSRWRDTGNGVEVVSEYEFLAAKKEGYLPERILVNGVGKHRWLGKHGVRGIRVHFDSINEVKSLLDTARVLEWRVGLRLHVLEEVDPDEPEFGGQFGMSSCEFCEAARLLRNGGVNIESVHFHLHSNVESPRSYANALKELGEVCREGSITPTYVDCGGGLPVPGEEPAWPENAQDPFRLSRLVTVLRDIPLTFPTAREVWLENGRFLTARSGVLVVKVVDVKERRESRYLICDGGRTNHALVSDWERHFVMTHPCRSGQQILTTVCGPTCMAFDRLIRQELPRDLDVGDFIIWHNAGAYHIPWETRFSGGLARVLWIGEDGTLSTARDAEDFKSWWSMWH